MTLSVCMIVKNEEHNIRRCLDSTKDLADEIIVVDTGSADRTMEIARGYGAKVYEHPWEDNFSLHRNQAFGYATGDWLLVLDADEEIVTDGMDFKAFKSRLAKIPEGHNALVVRVQEIGPAGIPTTNWLGIRFFRRSANPQYKNIVHNKVTYNGQCAGTDITLNHYGYSDPELVARKHERTERLLRKRLETNPSDFNALFYLCQIRVGQNKPDEASSMARQCLELLPIDKPEKLHYYGVLYFWAGMSALKLRNGAKAMSWALKGIELFPNDLDLNYLMARLGYEMEDDATLRCYSGRYFDLLPQHRDQGRFEAGNFVNVLDPKGYANRTTYTIQKEFEEQVREWVEGLKEAA